VALAAGGPAELVVPGQTGLLVPYRPAALAAAITRLLADPAGARALGAAGAQRVAACYTVERMVRQTEAVYRALVCARRGGRRA
jgi:glycosyltransferase involved in cell wall biosynthesis